MNIFLLFSAILWIAGFLSMKGIITLNADSIFEMNKVVVPPKWLYYLCGAPRSEGYPPNSITIGAFRVQMIGIAFSIFSVFGSVWRVTQDGFLFGLSISIIFPILLTLWIARSKRFSINHKHKK